MDEKNKGKIPEGFKPLLAIELQKVKTKPDFMYGCVKLDGIRATIFGGVAYSRSLKPIPNAWIQEWAWDFADELEGVDGEFVVGAPNAEDVFNKTTSACMSKDGKPDFTFFAFDKWHPTKTFFERVIELQQVVNLDIPKVEPVSYFILQTEDKIREFEEMTLEEGFEGIMLRDPDGKYKHGRSATKNPELIKVKRFQDQEFEVVGYECEYENQNEAKTNELGRTERSSSKAGLVAKASLGKLLLKDSEGRIFGCGSGFTKEQREQLWELQDELIGKLAKVKYFAVGMKDLPRFPIFLGFRAQEDTSD